MDWGQLAENKREEEEESRFWGRDESPKVLMTTESHKRGHSQQDLEKNYALLGFLHIMPVLYFEFCILFYPELG